MSETKNSKYNLLKSVIAARPIDERQLGFFKSLFEDQFYSRRRLHCIKILGDLLDWLERYDKLSEHDISPLQKIAQHFANDEIYMALEKYEAPLESISLQNVYALQRIQELHNRTESTNSEKPEADKMEPIIVFEFTQNKRDQIYKVISRDIGKTWRDFGREMYLRSGELDSIDTKYPNNLHSKVYEVFQIFEDDPQHDPRDHFNIICDALENCKRKDIRRSIQKIMRY